MPGHFRAVANQHRLAADFDLHGVVGHQPVAATDQIQRTLTLADAAFARDQHAQAQDIEENAVQYFARRHPVFEQRGESCDCGGRGRAGAQDGNAGALGFRQQFGGRLQPQRQYHARKIPGEEACQRLAPVAGRHALEIADLTLAKHQHPARPEVFVESSQGQACFLCIRQRDRPLEASGARQKIKIETGVGSAGPNQGRHRH